MQFGDLTVIWYHTSKRQWCNYLCQSSIFLTCHSNAVWLMRISKKTPHTPLPLHPFIQLCCKKEGCGTRFYKKCWSLASGTKSEESRRAAAPWLSAAGRLACSAWGAARSRFGDAQGNPHGGLPCRSWCWWAGGWRICHLGLWVWHGNDALKDSPRVIKLWWDGPCYPSSSKLRQHEKRVLDQDFLFSAGCPD